MRKSIYGCDRCKEEWEGDVAIRNYPVVATSPLTEDWSADLCPTCYSLWEKLEQELSEYARCKITDFMGS